MRVLKRFMVYVCYIHSGAKRNGKSFTMFKFKSIKILTDIITMFAMYMAYICLLTRKDFEAHENSEKPFAFLFFNIINNGRFTFLLRYISDTHADTNFGLSKYDTSDSINE